MGATVTGAGGTLPINTDNDLDIDVGNLPAAKKAAVFLAVEDDEKTVVEQKTSVQLKAELDALQAERKEDVERIEKLEKRVQQLAEEAKQTMIEAAKKQEKIVAEHEQEAKQVLEAQIQLFIQANKDKPGSMSKTELASNISSAIPNVPNLGPALALYAEANSQLDDMNIALSSINYLTNNVKLLDADIASKQIEYSNALSRENPPKSSDPIGFVVKGADGSDVKYDFIIDDGKFDSTKDFLGADKQWAEMEALDKLGNSDGVVTLDEFQNNNIKAVKTVNGKQEIVDLEEEFGSDFSVDLKSYQAGGTHPAIDLGDHDNDGVKNQTLLGTFNVNFGGTTIKGFNTLDDDDYLEKIYGVTGLNSDTEVASDVMEHVNFFNEFTSAASDLDEDLAVGYQNLYNAESESSQVKNQVKQEANKRANIFMDQLESDLKAKEAEEKAKAEKEEKAKEAKEAEQKTITIDGISINGIKLDSNGEVNAASLDAWYLDNKSTLQKLAEKQGTSYDDSDFETKVKAAAKKSL